VEVVAEKENFPYPKEYMAPPAEVEEEVCLYVCVCVRVRVCVCVCVSELVKEEVVTLNTTY
jgi:hypothetical protein